MLLVCTALGGNAAISAVCLELLAQQCRIHENEQRGQLFGQQGQRFGKSGRSWAKDDHADMYEEHDSCGYDDLWNYDEDSIPGAESGSPFAYDSVKDEAPMLDLHCYVVKSRLNEATQRWLNMQRTFCRQRQGILGEATCSEFWT